MCSQRNHNNAPSTSLGAFFDCCQRSCQRIAFFNATQMTETRTCVGETGTQAFDGMAGFRIGRT